MKLVTAVIQIGNSDDKLTQAEWAGFVAQMRTLAAGVARVTHFFGGSAIGEPWQNACWVIEIEEQALDGLRCVLKRCREAYRQKAVALTVGETEMV